MNRRNFLGTAAALSPVVAIAAKAVAASGAIRSNRILDFRGNEGTAPAFMYEVFDAHTGENLGKALPMFYANEATGVIRVLRRDNKGKFIYDYERQRPVSDEFRREVRILPKSKYADAIDRVEAYRRTPKGRRADWSLSWRSWDGSAAKDPRRFVIGQV